MAKRLNKNLVVVLTLAGMLLTTAAGVVLVQSLPQKSPKQWVAQAQEFEKQSPPDYIKAANYYQHAAVRAKQANDLPAMGEYMLKAGDLALKAGDAGGAYRIWNGLVVEDPSHLAAQEKIVTLQLEL